MTALNEQVLVLNKHWVADAITTVKEAIGLLFADKAEVVEVEDKEGHRSQFYTHNFDSWIEMSEFKAEFEKQNCSWVKSALLNVAAPRVIRLVDYGDFRRRVQRLSRRNIFARDHNICQYCGRKVKTSELSIDHVVPKSRGGKMEWTNVACACIKCNVRKADRTPAEARMRLLNKPKAPVYPFKVAANRRYKSWEHFIDAAYWNVELTD